MSTIGLNRIALLHIGDMHYPDAIHEEPKADVKDPSLESQLVKLASPDLFSRSIAKALEVFEEYRIDVILLSGDLTSGGDIKGYNDCVNYLINSGIIDLTRQSTDSVHVVPGNHDVDWHLVDSASTDYNAKFDPLRRAWDVHRFGIFMRDFYRASTVSNSTAVNSIKLVSLNSCIGCGVLHGYPPRILAFLQNELDRANLANDIDAETILKSEHLDLPLVSEQALTDALAEIGRLPDEIQPLILTHHNLLPQDINRISPYPELLNAGLVRTRLLDVNRPVLYVHGHLHKPPIEVISTPRKQNAKVICISAPLLKDGFNVLLLEFSKKGLPLGCIVIQFIINDNGTAEKTGEYQRITICNPLEAGRLFDEDSSQILEHVTSVEPERFPSLLQRIHKTMGKHLQKSTLANLLLEAQWAGIVSLGDFEEKDSYGAIYGDCQYWVVRRLP